MMEEEAHGLTLIELMIVVAIISIVAAITIPNILQCRMAANESTTIGTMKTIATQESIFQARREVDQDGNGRGEYGLLGELAGEIALRPGTRLIANPPYLSQSLCTGGNAGNGTAQKSGYMVMLYLSNAMAGNTNIAGNDKDLGGNTETGGPRAAPEAIPLQESYFVVYAWPTILGGTGYRSFFVNENGEVYWTRMEATTYDGLRAMPAANAAFINGGAVFRSRIASPPTPGNDRNQWIQTSG